jgi:pimeloyl-ACP methyl ester carboxylesterase
VFVHGWSCDRSYWRALDLPASQVVTVDLAGHGESGSGRSAWTLSAFGEDVVAVVSELGLSRVVLVGHSMGGDVAIEAALRMRERVAGIVWVDVYRELGAGSSAEAVAEQIAPFRRDFREATRAFVRAMFPPSVDRSLVEWVAEDMAAAPPSVALPVIVEAWSAGRVMPALLARLDLPVVAINPAEPASDVASLAVHGVSLVTMPGVGHFPMLEDPARFNARLREVIARF